MIKNIAKQVFNLSRIIYLCSILICVIITAIFFSSLDIEGYDESVHDSYKCYDEAIKNYIPSSIYNFYSSDALWMASFSEGIVKHHCIEDWNIGTCPNFFPSLFIYMLLTLLIKNTLLIQLANAFIQLLLFIILLNIVYKTIIPSISIYLISFANILFSLFLIWPLYYRTVIINTSLFLPYHIGPFLNALLSLILFINYIKSNRNVFLIFYGLLVIISVFCNNIYIMFFVLPATLSSLFFLKTSKGKSILIITGVTVIASIIGWAALRYFIINKLFYADFMPAMYANAGQSFQIALQQFKSLLVNGFLRRIIFFITFFLLLISIGMSVVFGFQHLKLWFSKNMKLEMNFFKFYIFYFSIFLVVSIAAPIILGIFFSEWEMRYCIFPIFLGLTNISLFIAYYLKDKYLKILRLFVITFCCALIFFIIIIYKKYTPFSVIEKVTSYYPGNVKAVDELSLKYPLKYGVGDHWDTKHVNGISRRGNKVYSIWSTSLYLRNFGNNRSSFFYTDCNKNDTVFFNYIIPRTLSDTAFIYNFFGDEIKRVVIDGYTFYLVPDFYYDRHTFAPIKTNRNAFIEIN